MLAVIAAAGVTYGSWTVSSSAGGGYSRALSMPTLAAPQTSLSYPNVSVGWAAATIGGSPVTSYTVRRYSETGVQQTILASCSGAISATSCTESSVPVGRWQWTVQPVKAAWLGPESGKSGVVEIAAAPSAISCTSCHGFGTSSYINAAGKASVTIAVTLPASSLATDTVHLSLTDSASHTFIASPQAAPAGAGTVTFSGLDTSSFVDGNVTVSAWVSANTGDTSPTATTTLVRDTQAPSASNIQSANGGSTAGKIENGDTVTYSFSEPVDPTTIISGWNGSAQTVSASISKANPSILTVASTNLGSVNLGAKYANATITCSSSTLAMSGSSITLTLGGCSSGATNVTTSTLTWTPSTSVTDQAGNPISTTTASESGAPKTNF